MKAAVLVKIKKLPEALAVLEKGHAVAPDNIDLLVAKGQILVTQSNFKAAAEELTRALAIEGSNQPILELRAALYEQLGEKAKALADVEKILKIKPGQPNVMRMRAVLLADLGKYDAAVEELQESAQGESQGFDDHVATGHALHEHEEVRQGRSKSTPRSWRITPTTWRPCAAGPTPS